MKNGFLLAKHIISSLDLSSLRFRAFDIYLRRFDSLLAPPFNILRRGVGMASEENRQRPQCKCQTGSPSSLCGIFISLLSPAFGRDLLTIFPSALPATVHSSRPPAAAALNDRLTLRPPANPCARVHLFISREVHWARALFTSLFLPSSSYSCSSSLECRKKREHSSFIQFASRHCLFFFSFAFT